ncbi:MAG: HipA domain-containing protein [Parvularculaceae bacterium]
MADLSSLDVLLHGEKIAALTLLPGDNTLLTFEEKYVQDQNRPTLSLSLKDAYGELITNQRPVRTRVPPFFSNLLPEGPLRAYLAKRAGVKQEREFHLLWALGQDLPGAVRIQPGDGAAWPEDKSAPKGLNANDAKAKALRFSLAGVQLKFSAVTKATGGMTIPASGQGGSWIVKLPSAHFPGVPENENAMMELARMAGMDVPETMLLPISEIEGLPDGMEQLGGNVFVIKRFDRSEDGSLIHIEDFAQIFGVYPDKKYSQASYRNLADVIASEVGDTGIQEYIRRIVFNALIGNADMHLKNWSLIYPDKRHAALAPAYDFVATTPYLPDDDMALRLGRSKRFDEFDAAQISYFAAKARLPEKFVVDTARETVQAFDDLWAKAKKELGMSKALIAALEKHRKIVPL